MLEVAAALSAGLGATVAILAIGVPAPTPSPDLALIDSWLRRRVRRFWAEENELAVGAGWTTHGASGFAAVQAVGAVIGGCSAVVLTGLPVLAAAGAAFSVGLIRSGVAARMRARQVIRQDAVLDSVRMLRQLLETGGTSVQAAIGVLGERGPLALRSEFRAIAGKSVGRRQAWFAARQRIREPLFDMLAAAVLIQNPSGGELAPLFSDLEASVSGAQEVEREARALQVQARSASALIVSLPVVFLVVLSTLRSPYLDAYHSPAGQAFLLAMLAVMAGSYVWMKRLLLLPGLQRVRLSDA